MANIDSNIAQVEQIFGVLFTDKLLGAESIFMGNPFDYVSVNGTACLVRKSVDLAIVGGSVLSTILCKMWYEARDAQGRRLIAGQWTAIRNEQLGNGNLGRLGFALGLDQCIIKGAGLNSVSNNMVAQTFEAVVGAVYIDAGAGNNAIETVRALVERVGLNNHPFLVPNTNHPRVVLEGEEPGPYKKEPREL